MRIVGGTFRGRPLKAPKSGTRPTTDRTREAIFNLVLARRPLAGARVLDLFAGSGALGLEALSRGAAHATFVEQAGAALRVLRENVAALGVQAQGAVIRGDAFRYLRTGAASGFDMVFADPPYELSGLDTLPDLVLPLLAPDGLFVLEHGTDLAFDEHPALETVKTYGGTRVTLFRAA